MNRPKLTIETAEKSGNSVQVFYFINGGELQEANIDYSRLKEFTVSMGLNSYCDNVFTGDYKEYDIDTYIAENLEEVVKDFLLSIYNPFEAIGVALDAIIVRFNNRLSLTA